MKTFLLLLVAGGSAGGYLYWQQNQERLKAEQRPKVPTATTERGSIKLSVASTGRVVANLDVDIKCKASGQVLKLPFDISDTVKKGDLLVELDPIDEQRAVDQAKTAVASTEAKLAQARQNLKIAEQKLVTDKMRADAGLQQSIARAQRTRIKADRLKIAMAGNAATKEEAETAETDAVEASAQVDISKAQIEELKTEEASLEVKRQDIALAEAQNRSDQVSLANAQQRLTDTKVIAPMNGVVSARTIQIGTIISSAISNVGGGTTVLTLSDLSHVFTLGAVDESDIGKVEVGLPVIVTTDAYAGRPFRGKVVRVATRGTNVSNVVTFEVKIEILDERKTMLKPEMTTNLEIIAAQKEDALLIPSDAVVRKQGKRMVNLKKPDGSTEDREVQTGINDGMKIEITDGLKEGDVVTVHKSDADSKWKGSSVPRGMFPLGGGGHK